MQAMQSIRFTVPGVPTGKGRPRFAVVHGRSMAYTDERTKEYENRVKAAYLKKFGRLKMSGTLQVDIIAYFEPPKSARKRRRQMMLDGDIPYDKKPDGDNIQKAVLDALNGVAYDDDKYIVAGYWFKGYAEQAHTDVIITRIGGRYGYETD